MRTCTRRAPRIVYRLDGKKWSKKSEPFGRPISRVRGSAPDDLYAIGEGGLVRHYDGTSWKPVALSSDSLLRGLLSPKDVLICGDGGSFFRGGGTKWKSLPQRGVDLFDLDVFMDRIYVAAGGGGVWTFDGKRLANVKDSFPAYRLSASAKYLTAAGGADAIRFDGAERVGPTYT